MLTGDAGSFLLVQSVQFAAQTGGEDFYYSYGDFIAFVQQIGEFFARNRKGADGCKRSYRSRAR